MHCPCVFSFPGTPVGCIAMGLAGLVPVSYTHLVEALCNKALWLHKGEFRASGPSSGVIAEYDSWLNTQIHADTANPSAAALGIGVRGHAAVSYTHLDVYKRQVPAGPQRGEAASC